jgi:site-specific DNA-adenine methylase
MAKTKQKAVKISFQYPGAKSRWVKHIISELPAKAPVFLDAFAGKGNVGLNVLLSGAKDYGKTVFNDLRTATFFEAVKSLGDNLRLPPPEEFRGIIERGRRGELDGDPYYEAIECWVTFSGGGWTAGPRPLNRPLSEKYYRTCLRNTQAVLLQSNVFISSEDYQAACAKLGPDDIAYIDPPYRKSSVHGYKKQDLDHDELVRFLQAAKFKWLLSEYDHDQFYSSKLGTPFWTRNIYHGQNTFDENGKAGAKHKPTVKVECMWRNYEIKND